MADAGFLTEETRQDSDEKLTIVQALRSGSEVARRVECRDMKGSPRDRGNRRRLRNACHIRRTLLIEPVACHAGIHTPPRCVCTILLAAFILLAGPSCLETACESGDRTCDVLSTWTFLQSVTPIIVMGDATGKVHRTADGYQWATTTLDSGFTISDFEFARGTFWAVSSNNPGFGTVFYSTDGVTWQSSTSGLSTSNGLYGIAFGNGRFTIVSRAGGGNQAFYSSDGINWTANADADLAGYDFVNVNCMSFVGSLFVGGEDVGGIVTYSSDGLDWTPGTSAASSATHFGKQGDYFFWVDAGTFLLYAKTILTGATPPAVAGLTNIRAASTGRFSSLAVGDAGVIHRSFDGLNWSSNLNADTSVNLTTVTCADVRLCIAGGASGAYYVSKDGGANWTGPYSIPAAGNLVTSITRSGFPY